MWLETGLLTLATFAASVFLTFAARKVALARGLLDVPNQRSSHAVPTPRGGGIAVVVSATAAFSILAVLHRLQGDVFLALLGGVAVAIVGFADDRRPLPPAVRLAVHLGAALWALAWLGGLPPLHIGGEGLLGGPIGYLFGTLGIVWTLNLFNFMDGIDGVAASEAMFVVWAGALLLILLGPPSAIPALCLAFGAACCGFLVWNWPPAKIFMGDVGSGYIGYVIAVLAISAARDNTAALPVWLILGGVFLVDATVTLVRRLARRERVYEAHRSHAYQWLARRWGSHRRVTVSVVLVNLLWLLPCAFVATFCPNRAIWIVLGALAPLGVAAVAAGAGRREGA